MANKIFRSILFVAILVLGMTTVFIVDEMYQSFLLSQMELLEAETKIIAYGIEKNGVDFIDDLDRSDYRVTLIEKDGSVIFDNSGNDVSSMDNHLDREEVIQAINEGYGSSSRQSSTLTEKLVYTAMRLSNGNIVRLSSTYPSIFHVVTIVAQPLLLVVLAIIVLSFFIAYSLAKRIVEPLNQLDVDSPDDDNCYKEIKPIMKKLSNQQEMIDHDRKMLERRKQEFETITANMNEGLVLLNNEKMIIDINHSASIILNIDQDVIGKHISEVEGYDQFSDLLIDAQMKHHGSRKIRLGNRNYEFEVSPVKTDQEVQGFVLLFFDESYKEANENMRREFAANVSHEMKTPLQSISGYAELLRNGMVGNDDRNEVYNRVYYEAQRMIQLVNDVIKLSHLDEGNLNIPKEKIDLSELSKQIVDAMKPEIRNGVTIDFKGSEAFVYGNRELLQTIVSNLCENAIRYNRDNGTVDVSVYTKDDQAILEVKDSGVGIEEKDHERIFERFYRVDKGRSKEVGGTGLGLSIVKHACILNNAQIEVESKIDEGSTFRVIFDRI